MSIRVCIGRRLNLGHKSRSKLLIVLYYHYLSCLEFRANNKQHNVEKKFTLRMNTQGRKEQPTLVDFSLFIFEYSMYLTNRVQTSLLNNNCQTVAQLVGTDHNPQQDQDVEAFCAIIS